MNDLTNQEFIENLNQVLLDFPRVKDHFLYWLEGNKVTLKMSINKNGVISYEDEFIYKNFHWKVIFEFLKSKGIYIGFFHHGEHLTKVFILDKNESDEIEQENRLCNLDYSIILTLRKVFSRLERDLKGERTNEKKTARCNN